MTEGPKDSGLSTADMVAAGGRQSAAPASLPTSQDKSSATMDSVPLFPRDDAQRFRARWDAVQTSFVDDPRQAVEQADHLVAEVMKHLAAIFDGERGKLESQWSRGDSISTEDLRVALQRYRSFFTRLLSV